MSIGYKMKDLIAAILTTCFVFGACTQVRAQTYMETYGQNRIQTRKYDWRFFDTEHFRIFHYDAAGRQLARYVAEQAEKDIKVVERKMGGNFPSRFHIILYNNYDEYRQTNIGRKYDSQLQHVPAGTVDLVGDKLVVYFTGVHTDVRRQLRAGMSKVVMQQMLFGDNLREMVRNAVLLNLPQWATAGYIAYLVDGWDAKAETDWKNLLQAQAKPDFYEMAEKEPELAGKAFWKFIAESYGEGTVKTLLYNMQQKSSLPQGVKLTLGLKVKDAYDSVINFYAGVYEKDASVLDHPDSANKSIIDIPVPRHPKEIRNIRVAPKGNDVAYVEWKEGEFKVMIQRTRDEQTKSVIIAGGAHDYNEAPDPDYPLLAWSNNGYKLAVLYKQNRKTRLRIYNSLNAKLEDYVVPNNRFDRVLGMSFMEDDSKIVFSAIKKSQTDLYEFTIKRARITPITSDAWDDMQPWFVSGGSRRGILFLSNRPLPNLDVPMAVNELPTGAMNLFFYDTRTRRRELLQASFITKGTITQPIQYGSDHFAFLNDANGIVNKYVVLFGRDRNNMDSAYAVPITNYAQSIISHQYNPASNQVADVVQVGKSYKVYFKPLQIPGINATEKQLEPTTLSVANELHMDPVVEQTNTVIEPKVQRSPSILPEGNVFQSEFEDEMKVNKQPEEPVALVEDEDTLSPEATIVTADPYPANDIDSVFVDSTYVRLRAQPYRLSLKPDLFTVRVDNSILFNKYQPAGALGGLPPNQNLSGLITVTLDDVMEDHRFTAGFRLPINLSGSTYFLQYDNFKRRVDWGLLFFRDVNYYNYSVTLVDPRTGQQFQLPNSYTGKLASNILQGHVSYPLDRIRSVKLHLGFRQDVLNYRAVDSISLKYLETDRQYWTMSRVEYVFDNTVNPVLNIRKGLRYKIFGEYFYRLSAPNGGFYNFGLDVRHYQPVYRNIVFASRLAYAHSGGNQQVNYVMGGVDNWLLARQSNMPPPTSQNFAFQALANNLRGYPQNARRGNTYGVINAELRAPILASILKRPIQSAFLKNLQAIAFADAGSAWNGLVPANSDRDYIFSTGTVPNITVALPSPDYGLAVGYGAGLRTMLFGYFMRVDAAWNIEGKTTRPMWIFSLGTDF